MSSSPSSSSIAAVRLRLGGAWWPARFALASQRSGPFVARWSAIVGAATLVALAVPLLSTDGGEPNRGRLERAAADTLRSAQRLRTAEARVTAADSALVAARQAPVRAPQPAEPRVNERAPQASTVAITTDDPAVLDFSQRIAAARRQRTVPAYLEVAAHPAVASGPRMRQLADSIQSLDSRRAALPADSVDELNAVIGRVGRTIIAIAEFRLREIGGVAGDSIVAPPPAAPVPAAVVARPAPADTSVLLAAAAAARDSLGSARRAHDSTTAVIRSIVPLAGPEPRSLLAKLAPALALLTVLVVGLAARLLVALRQEAAAPSLAGASEAERLTGLRVLAVVRDAPAEGPARFKPTGVDPFRMLYLGLTATGTRARTAIVVGDDPDVASSVGARLAIAAAADHRSTLVVDLDPVHIGLSRNFRERAEPGLSDVMARAFTWREVARPVGSSDGLPITLVPAGTERDDRVTGEAHALLVADFVRLRASYELTLVVCAPTAIALGEQLIEGSPVVMCVVAGSTPLASLEEKVASIKSGGRKVQGLVMWSAPAPQLPTRGELAALLSKRKGRTPGGSFEAVRRAVDPQNSGTKKP